MDDNIAIDSMMAAVNLRKESVSEMAIDGYQAEALFYAAIAQTQAAERQATALERIAAVLEHWQDWRPIAAMRGDVE